MFEVPVSFVSKRVWLTFLGLSLSAVGILGCKSSDSDYVVGSMGIQIQEFSAKPERIYLGQSTTLKGVWSRGYAYVDHNVGEIELGVGRVVRPTTTTTYTLNAVGYERQKPEPGFWTPKGTGGHSSRTLTVQVDPIPTVTLEARDAAVTAGQAIVLTAHFPEGEGVVGEIEGIGPIHDGLPLEVVSPAVVETEDRTFRLQVDLGQGVKSYGEAVVRVVPAPVIEGFGADRVVIPYGSRVGVVANFRGGTGSVDGVGVVESGKPFQVGPVLKPLSLRLVVENEARHTVSQVLTIQPQTVEVGAIAPADPVRTVGGTTVFGATVAGGAQGGILWTASGGVINEQTGSWVAPTTPGAVVITATSKDDPTRSRSTTVNVVAAPQVGSFASLNVNPVYGGQGSFTPVFSGGDGVVDQGIGPVVSGAPVNTGALTGPKTFTLTVTNPAGDRVSSTLAFNPQTVVVRDLVAPLLPKTVGAVVKLAVSVNGGLTNRVEWSATGGNIEQDGKWELPTVGGVYRATATSIEDTSKTASATVTVVAAPQAASLVASSETPSFGSTLSLTPNYSGGVGTLTHGLTCSGSGVPIAGIPVDWVGSRTFVLTVTNAAGDAVTSSVVVTPMAITVGAITPQLATKTVNSATNFSASATGGATNALTWSASAGTMNPTTGAWTAPSTAQSVTITATSVEDPSKTSTATVTVVGMPVATSLTASSSTPQFGSSFTLTPVYQGGTGAIDNGVACPGTGAASGGITANWSGPRIFTLTVTNAAGATAQATVTVTPQVVNVGSVSPAAPTKTMNTSTTFSAVATGGVTNALAWSASAGTMNPTTGACTAPNTAQSVTITATSVEDPSKTSTTTVTVVGMPVATSLTASSSTPQFGSSFTLTPVFQGGTGSIDNGVICPGTGAASGAITANWSGPRTFTLTVTNAAGATALATVTVTPQVVNVGSVSPAAPTKSVNTSTTFSATASGGAMGGVTWSASAGSINPSTGAWTAPGTAQTVTITATSNDDNSKSSSTTVTVVAAATASISASTTSPAYGSTTVTVTPTFTGATTTVVGTTQGGNDISASPSTGVAIGVQAGGFTVARTYWVRATNAAGDHVDASVTVTPQTVSVGAVSPAGLTRTVTSGSATFSATASGGATGGVTYSASAGSINPSTGAWTAPATAQTVTITATSNDDNSKSSSTTVTVVAAATASISANTTSPAYGSTTVTVTPTFTGATTTVVGTTQGGNDISASPSTGVAIGVQTGGFTVARTYWVRATNAAGDHVDASVTVTPQTVSVGAVSPAGLTRTVTSGSATFSATASGGATNGVTYSASAGSINPSTGAWTAPGTAQTVTITATSNDDNTKTSTTTVTVVAAPVASGISAAKATVTSGTSTTVTPTFSNGTGKIGTSGAGSQDLTASASSGVAVGTGNLASTMTYTLTVTNAAGDTATASTTVTVVAAATASISASTTSPAYGATTVTVTPTFAGATTTVVGTSQGGSDISASPSTGVAIGVQTGGFTVARTYWVRATNAAGDYVDGSVTVTPQTVSVGAVSPAGITRTVTSGSATFSATASGGATNGVTYSASAGTIDPGTGAWTAPGSAQTVTITATSNDDNTKTSTTTVTVVAAPVASAFAANPTTVTSGGTSNLTFTFSGGAGKVGTTNGGGEVAGSVPSGGSTNVNPTVTTTYYLTVTNAAGDTASATATVTVTAGAAFAISTFTAPALVDFGDPVLFEWTFGGTPTALTFDGGDVLGLNQVYVTAARRKTYQLSGTDGSATDSQSLEVASRGFDLLAGLPGGTVNSEGQVDGPEAWASFLIPSGLACGVGGTVYVADKENHVIRVIGGGGVVMTHAGVRGNAGHADGPSGVGQLHYPENIVADQGGNIYVSDATDHRIRIVDSTGEIRAFVGSPGVAGSDDGTGSSATFNYPRGLSMDNSGNIYVADSGNRAIRMITPGGEVTTLAACPSGNSDGPVGGGGEINSLEALAWAPGGIYFLDGNRVRVFAGGEISTLAGRVGESGGDDGMGSGATFLGPTAIAYHPDGYLLVTDMSVVRKVDFDGTVTKVAGQVYSTGYHNGPGAFASFGELRGIGINGFGEIFLADAMYGMIRSLATSWDVFSYAGRTAAATVGALDGSGDAASFSSPGGVVVDSQGNTYVADSDNYTIRKITPSGVVTTLAGVASTYGDGDGVGGGATFGPMSGMALDPVSGDLFVAQPQQHNIRRITPAGVVSTFAGVSGVTGAGNGARGAATFNEPTGLAFAADGTLYVTDKGNFAIRKIATNGVVSTLATLGATTSLVGLVVEPSDNTLRVCDAALHVVYRVEQNGTVTEWLGQNGANGTGDGVGTGASLEMPLGIARDSAGNYWITGARGLRGVREDRVTTIVDGTPTLETRPGKLVLGANSNNSGQLATLIGNGLLGVGRWIAVAPNGDLVITTGNHVMAVTAPPVPPGL